MQKNPDEAASWIQQGHLCSAQERSEQALAAYRRALEIEGTHSSALNSCISALRDLYRWDEAEALVAKAHQVCPYSNATRNNIDVKLTVE